MEKQNQYNDLREKLNRTMDMRSKPKLCSLCKRASFLKCMECDTIYCSSKCQIRDWEQHQKTHAHIKNNGQSRKNNFQPMPPSSRHESVQGRLKAALNKPVIKVNVDEQLRVLDEKMRQGKHDSLSQNTATTETVTGILPHLESAVKIESNAHSLVDSDISSRFESAVKIEESSRPLAIEESVIDQNILKMKKIRNFKRHNMFGDEGKDSKGFSFVYVTEMEEKVDGSLVCWIMPHEVKESYKNFKKTLNQTYEDDSIPCITSIEDLKKFKSHIVIAQIEGNWCRAQILSMLEPEIVAFEDIDTGKKTIVNINTSSQLIKIVQEREMMQPAFAIKVAMNDNNFDLETGDIVKMRLTHTDGFGIAQAEVKLVELDSGNDSGNSIEEKMEIEQEFEMRVDNQVRHFIDEVSVKDFHVGPGIKLIYCDGSTLEKGLVHVCEALQENWKFYDGLSKEIAKYVKENPNALGHKPLVRELVLAKFTDDCFYRAVCLKASDSDASIHFLEYGCVIVVDNKDIMALPTKFLYVSCSHTVQVKLVSGRPVTDINAEETRERLMEINVFEATVEIVPGSTGKYIITLADDLVVFNN